VIVSHSEVDAYLLCERRHYYAFGERLQRKSQSESLTRGILGHQFMDAFFQRFKETGSFDVALNAIDGIISSYVTAATPVETAKMLIDLHKRIVGFLTLHRSRIETWKIVHIESTFRVPMDHIMEGLTFAFQPDLIIEVNGQWEVVDWKYPYNFYNPQSMSLLPQLPKYISGLRQLGHIVRTGHYAEIRYRSMKDPSPGQLYKITPYKPSPANLRRTWHEYSIAVAEIAKYKTFTLPEWEGGVLRVGNNLVCRSCSFKDLCVAEKEGSDGLAIRRNMFEPSTYGYVEVDDNA
jgi:hypothetical protein